jgi:hypothetical protein
VAHAARQYSLRSVARSLRLGGRWSAIMHYSNETGFSMMTGGIAERMASEILHLTSDQPEVAGRRRPRR